VFVGGSAVPAELRLSAACQFAQAGEADSDGNGAMARNADPAEPICSRKPKGTEWPGATTRSRAQRAKLARGSEVPENPTERSDEKVLKNTDENVPSSARKIRFSICIW
jgi:hypothetical protein